MLRLLPESRLEVQQVLVVMHSKPLVNKFFDWVYKQFEQLGLLPSNP